MKENGNVVNVSKLMHDNSKLRISPEAVKELVSRFQDKLYDLAPLFDKTALRHGRKTVFDEDIIEVLSFADNEIL
jgi:histone H3/H4